MDAIEFERYELREGPAYQFASDRRGFLKTLGGGILLLVALGPAAEGQESGRGGRRGQAMPADVGAWLHIAQNGDITVYTGKVEVGQNARTALTQAVSEELRVAPGSVRVVMGDTDLCPYDMGTFGSRTTPTMAPQLRKAAAAAREMMLDLAAEKWHAERGQLEAREGSVRNRETGAAVSYAELTHGQKLVRTIAADAKFAQPVGTSLPKVNGEAIVTGRHEYTSDLKRPGMMYGRVLRPAAFGAKLESLDASGANGTAQVVREKDFVGVVAKDEFAAAKALGALKAEWKAEAQPGSKELFEYLEAHAEQKAAGANGVDASLASAAHRLEATYTVAYIAHTPLEPRAAVAEWDGDRLTVHTGTQVPFGVKAELAEAFGIPAAQVHVIVPDTGSGYGGKHTGECAIEAARMAKAAGKPVKLIWTREEELTWAYFRPAGVIKIRGGVSADGKLAAWDYVNFNSGPSGLDTPYETASKNVQFYPSKSPLRQGSYRGLAATANHFARESFVDELAHASGADPLAFRYRNLTNERMKAVLAAAAERFGWGKPSAAGRAAGIACGFDKGGYVACCAEISMAAPGKVKIERVAISFECGAIVNPKHLENQVEGSVVMAIGGALFERIDFENGRVLTNHLAKYRVPRFGDLPKIDVVLLDRKDLPSAGAGETSIVGLAPAVGNAIFRATGQRVRSLPMLPALEGGARS